MKGLCLSMDLNQIPSNSLSLAEPYIKYLLYVYLLYPRIDLRRAMWACLQTSGRSLPHSMDHIQYNYVRLSTQYRLCRNEFHQAYIGKHSRTYNWPKPYSRHKYVLPPWVYRYCRKYIR